MVDERFGALSYIEDICVVKKEAAEAEVSILPFSYSLILSHSVILSFLSFLSVSQSLISLISLLTLSKIDYAYVRCLEASLSQLI